MCMCRGGGGGKKKQCELRCYGVSVNGVVNVVNIMIQYEHIDYLLEPTCSSACVSTSRARSEVSITSSNEKSDGRRRQSTSGSSLSLNRFVLERGNTNVSCRLLLVLRGSKKGAKREQRGRKEGARRNKKRTIFHLKNHIKNEISHFRRVPEPRLQIQRRVQA